jgi:MFS transporter, DHA1 family, multidrug resistance protein
VVGAVLFIANWRLLPETLHREQRQPFNARNLLRGYGQLGSSEPFVLLCLASGVPFNGMFLYVLSSPVFLGDLLGLAPSQFFWFFLVTVSQIMLGAWISGRMAGRMRRKRQIRWGFVVMFVAGVGNLLANLVFTATIGWVLIPLGLFALGWAMMVPAVTLMVLDLFPERRGMASSLQAVIGSVANGIVAGVVAPLVMHSTVLLAATSLAMLGIGLVAWLVLRWRWPATVNARESA